MNRFALVAHRLPTYTDKVALLHFVLFLIKPIAYGTKFAPYSLRG
jgi:hypothetical protein